MKSKQSIEVNKNKKETEKAKDLEVVFWGGRKRRKKETRWKRRRCLWDGGEKEKRESEREGLIALG